jgi:hypothetical protein
VKLNYGLGRLSFLPEPNLPEVLYLLKRLILRETISVGNRHFIGGVVLDLLLNDGMKRFRHREDLIEVYDTAARAPTS